MVGGLKAVVITETIQTVLLIAGCIAVTVFAILALPDHGINTVAEFKAALRPGQISMIHTDNSVGLAWYSVLLGYPILGIWYWCTDQTIVQRVLAARSEHDAQIGPLFAGFIKILPVFIMVFPGVIGYVLFKSEIGEEANQVLPVLINRLIPTGLKGLISARLLAALMSTIAAALNSCATLVAVDIVTRLRPQTTDLQQVRIGRWSAVGIMLIAMAWSTQGGRFTSILEAVQVIAADLAPPITTVFLWGVFWRRGTSQAALTTLIFGFLMGACAFVVDLPLIGDQKMITDGFGIPFMMQAWWGFVICSVVFVIVSLATPPPPPEKIEGLTWEHPWSVISRPHTGDRIDPRKVAGVLIFVLAALYLIMA